MIQHKGHMGTSYRKENTKGAETHVQQPNQNKKEPSVQPFDFFLDLSIILWAQKYVYVLNFSCEQQHDDECECRQQFTSGRL